MKVKDMMHDGASSVSPQSGLAAVASAMKTFDVGAIPVLENGMLIGIVTDRDIALRAFANGKDVSALTARDVMTPDPVTCRDTDKVKDALDLMEQHQIRRLPVLDDDAHLVGMISLGDISHALSRKEAGEMTRAVSAHHG
jgi:CBS domain-containing protein